MCLMAHDLRDVTMGIDVPGSRIVYPGFIPLSR